MAMKLDPSRDRGFGRKKNAASADCCCIMSTQEDWWEWYEFVKSGRSRGKLIGEPAKISEDGVDSIRKLDALPIVFGTEGFL